MSYKKNWESLIDALLPKEVTVFGYKLERMEYLAIAGLGIFLLIVLGALVNRHWIKKEVEGYADAFNELLETNK